MGYVLFIFYFIFSLWIFPKISFLKNTRLRDVEIRLLISLKIFSGVLCAWYIQNKFPLGDHLSINEIGKIHYAQFLSNPELFFSDVAIDIKTYGLGGLFDSSESFWAYLRFNLLFKFSAILNLFTHGNFYLNSAVFSSIVFFGHIAFYRIFSDMYKGHKLKILFVCFCLPSILLYTSCVHKDGLVFLSIGLISFVFYSFLKNTGSINIKYMLIFLLGIAAIFLFRNYVLVALIPAMASAFMSKALPYKKRIVFTLSYFIYAGLFFLSGLLNNSFNLPVAVVKRKADFAGLGEASTNIAMHDLYPNIKSFLFNLPQAINHTLLRPYLWEFSNPGVMLTALELFFYQGIIIAFIFFKNKKETITNSFNLYAFAFFISMMLIIGYTIPNIGAIVRYRSIFWIFILCPMLCCTDWSKLNFIKKMRLRKIL